MDGLGLAMFIPLLQMVDGKNTVTHAESMGNMSFLVKIFNYFGVSLTLGVVLLVIVIFFSLKGLLKFIEGYTRVVYEQMFIKNIREGNIHGLSQFSYNIFVNTDTGRIQNTFSGEVEKVKQANRYYFISIQYGVFVSVYIFMAFFANPQFAVLVVVGGALTNIIFRRLQKTTKSLSKKITAQGHAFQGLLIQKVTFFKYLKATGLISTYADKLIETNRKILHSQRKTGIISAALAAIREPMIIAVVVLVIVIQVNYFRESIGLIVLSLLLFYRGLVSLMSMQNYWNLFLTMSGSLQNMTLFNKELIKGREKNGKIIFREFKNKIELKDISFFYEDTKILQNINLINILSGLIIPVKGNVLIDNINLEELKKETYQRRIGYITQEPVIFNDTIFNNVTFWDVASEENKERFRLALQQASIYDFMMEQPLQEEALLGSNGINISGGQKQRLSIARELYKEVDYLFMDEATSALDSETERSIQENIETLRGKYTIIIIAHRLSTIKNVDRIILLNKGSVEKMGTFDELCTVSASFKKMVELQGF